MTNFSWTLQGSTPTTIDTDDILQFAGAAFGDPLQIGTYNNSTHVKSSIGANDSGSNSPRNNKFISQTGGSGGKSQVAVDGGATVNLDTLINSQAALKLNVSDVSAFGIIDAIFYSYGANTITPLPGLDVRAAEIGDTNFTECEGSSAALALTDQTTPATSHDYYIVISKSPITPGIKSDTLRLEVVLQ